jgi:hypothetical protein
VTVTEDELEGTLQSMSPVQREEYAENTSFGGFACLGKLEDSKSTNGNAIFNKRKAVARLRMLLRRNPLKSDGLGVDNAAVEEKQRR